jgi:cell division septation protein DedD
MTLESRHLIGIFLGLVVICGVFFTLGYVMGRTQYDTTVRAAASPKPHPADLAALANKSPEKSAAIPAADWTFPKTTEAAKPVAALEPPPPKTGSRAELSSAPPPRASAPVKPGGAAKAPVIPRGASVLQVAALSREADALALAQVLQQKQFPAFVLQPMGDNLYRVQVGPYGDSAAADAGKKALQREGFKAILKK